MDIACSTDATDPWVLADAPHRELTATNMLSVLGNTIPFPDMNQSPRNMYQCQVIRFCCHYHHCADGEAYYCYTLSLSEV